MCFPRLVGAERSKRRKTWSDKSLQGRREEPLGTESLHHFRSLPNGSVNAGSWISRKILCRFKSCFVYFVPPHLTAPGSPGMRFRVCDCYHTHLPTHYIVQPLPRTRPLPSRCDGTWPILCPQFWLSNLLLIYLKFTSFSSLYLRCSLLDQTRSLNCLSFTQQHVDVICSKLNRLHSQTK